MSWKIQFYRTLAGRTPVEDFVQSLQPTTVAKLYHQFRLLEEYGPRLGMPSAKPIGDGLFELRVRGNEEVRALYIFQIGETVVVLHGFKKKTMSILKRDLVLALQRKHEVEQRNI
jgi:phage-related protein